MVYQVKLNGTCYEVDVANSETEILSVTAIQAQAEPAQTSSQPSAAPGSGEAVCAPMPGAVIGIQTAVGQTVKKGQVLFILEAMKMENEIVSPRDGTVSGVAVERSSTVSAGDVLAYLA